MGAYLPGQDLVDSRLIYLDDPVLARRRDDADPRGPARARRSVPEPGRRGDDGGEPSPALVRRFGKVRPMLKVVHNPAGSNVLDPAAVSSSLLDEIVRDGARQMLAAAMHAEVAAYVAARPPGAR